MTLAELTNRRLMPWERLWDVNARHKAGPSLEELARERQNKHSNMHGHSYNRIHIDYLRLLSLVDASRNILKDKGIILEEHLTHEELRMVREHRRSVKGFNEWYNGRGIESAVVGSEYRELERGVVGTVPDFAADDLYSVGNGLRRIADIGRMVFSLLPKPVTMGLAAAPLAIMAGCAADESLLPKLVIEESSSPNLIIKDVSVNENGNNMYTLNLGYEYQQGQGPATIPVRILLRYMAQNLPVVFHDGTYNLHPGTNTLSFEFTPKTQLTPGVYQVPVTLEGAIQGLVSNTKFAQLVVTPEPPAATQTPLADQQDETTQPISTATPTQVPPTPTPVLNPAFRYATSQGLDKSIVKKLSNLGVDYQLSGPEKGFIDAIALLSKKYPVQDQHRILDTYLPHMNNNAPELLSKAAKAALAPNTILGLEFLLKNNTFSELGQPLIALLQKYTSDGQIKFMWHYGGELNSGHLQLHELAFNKGISFDAALQLGSFVKNGELDLLATQVIEELSAYGLESQSSIVRRYDGRWNENILDLLKTARAAGLPLPTVFNLEHFAQDGLSSAERRFIQLLGQHPNYTEQLMEKYTAVDDSLVEFLSQTLPLGLPLDIINQFKKKYELYPFTQDSRLLMRAVAENPQLQQSRFLDGIIEYEDRLVAAMINPKFMDQNGFTAETKQFMEDFQALLSHHPVKGVMLYDIVWNPRNIQAAAEMYAGWEQMTVEKAGNIFDKYGVEVEGLRRIIPRVVNLTYLQSAVNEKGNRISPRELSSYSQTELEGLGLSYKNPVGSYGHSGSKDSKLDWIIGALQFAQGIINNSKYRSVSDDPTMAILEKMADFVAQEFRHIGPDTNYIYVKYGYGYPHNWDFPPVDLVLSLQHGGEHVGDSHSASAVMVELARSRGIPAWEIHYGKGHGAAKFSLGGNKYIYREGNVGFGISPSPTPDKHFFNPEQWAEFLKDPYNYKEHPYLIYGTKKK